MKCFYISVVTAFNSAMFTISQLCPPHPTPPPKNISGRSLRGFPSLSGIQSPFSLIRFKTSTLLQYNDHIPSLLALASPRTRETQSAEVLTSSRAFLLSVWRQGRGTEETNKCSLSAWGVEGLSGQCWLAVGSLSAADIQICLLCWCFREFSRGLIEDLLLHHLHHLLLPLVIHPTVSCYQVYFPGNQLSWIGMVYW